jgi:hypothetical protein
MIAHSLLNRNKTFLQGPVDFNMRVLYKLDSPWHVSECISFVFREGTVNVVKIQKVLTESPNLSAMLCFRNKPPMSARVCCIEYIYIYIEDLHALISWLDTVCAAVCLVFGDFAYMPHKHRWFCLKHLWHLILNNHLIDVYYKSFCASSDQKSIFNWVSYKNKLINHIWFQCLM